MVSWKIRKIYYCFVVIAACSFLVYGNLNKDPKTDSSRAATENKKEREIVRHKSATGLEWEIKKEGEGNSAKKGDKVTVHYTGWLTDENGEPDLQRKFDSSVDRGQPFSFTVGAGRVIKGWDEGLVGMKIGETRRLFIPANLGYGDRGHPPVIPANSTLIFDVKLLAIN